MPEHKQKLDRLVQELQKKHGETVNVEVVVGIIGRLIASGKNNLEAMSQRVYGELEALHQRIEETKAEISSLRPDDVKDEYLPTAALELDAIVEATAEATHAIMDAAEAIEQVMDGLDGEHQEILMGATTRIYEACGFQDITGQRITKVVNVLQEIESRVDALLGVFGDELARAKAEHSVVKSDDKEPDDAELLQGPQLAGEGISQDEIDRLLAEFD